MNRRHFLTLVGASAAALAVDGAPALAGGVATPGPSPFGPLQPANALGLRLPAGFTSRVVARSGQVVGSTGYRWHRYPDGGAVYPRVGGGWTYVCNSEVFGPAGQAGAGALRFDSAGRIVGAYRVLRGTTANCSGGETPWGTWLSCEEHTTGRVWECNPAGPGQGTPRPALGRFAHEMVTVDPDEGRLYLTEDGAGVADEFYRFTPTNPLPDLTAGTLEVLQWNQQTGAVTWVTVDASIPSQTRRQNGGPRGTAFNGNEGVWYDQGHVYFTAKVANRVYDLDIAAQELTVMWDAADYASPILSGVDNLVMDKGHNLYVAEDGGNMELVLITDNTRRVAPFLRVMGQAGSEITGPAFSPNGQRLYFSSQRGGPNSTGITYEVKGPFPA